MKHVKDHPKGLVSVGAFFFITGLYILNPVFQGHVNTVISLFLAADIEGLKSYIKGFGVWGPVVSMALMVFQALVSPFPAFVLTFANAKIYGWILGAIISWTGAMLGAAVCFTLARRLGRPLVERAVGRESLAKTDCFLAKYGSHSIMIARLLPIMPFDLVSYAAGLTSLGLWRFLLATGIGQLPATIVYSWLGENMALTSKYLFWAISGFLALLVFSLAVKQRFELKLRGEHDA